MNAITSLAENLNWGHNVVETTVGDMTAEQLHQVPPGLAHPVSALYAHVVIGEDMIVNGMIKGGAPLMATTFAGKTGTSDPQFQLTPEWARAVKVDLPAFKAYAQAVYQATLDYVATLSEADLEQTRDLSQVNMGTPTVGWMFNALVAGHINNLAGEISAIKGVNGLKGYPF